MTRVLSLDDFMFPLDESLIAQDPLPERTSSRLLVRGADGSFDDRVFADLVDLLPQGSLLVVNDSRVMASRLIGKLPTGGRVELLLLEKQDGSNAETWLALGKPMRKLKPGTRVLFPAGLEGKIVVSPSEKAGLAPVEVRFSMQGAALGQWLEQHGIVPLPPYIARDANKPSQSKDRERYQTVYAREEGSAAAPTAGLHFSADLVRKLQEKDIHTSPVTLHVGLGTFLPVKEQDLSLHRMHEERFLISSSTCEAILSAKKEGRPVIMVGTTSFRCVEGFHRLFQTDEAKRAHCNQWLRTSIFIRPEHDDDRYRPFAADGIVTNFHLPGSTLFMLVSALIGWREARRLYDHAMAQRYRFFSYGDASLLKLTPVL